MEHMLSFGTDGSAKTIYTEDMNLETLGKVSLKRASHVEPTENGKWTADMSPVGGPILGPFGRRSEALQAEVAWLEANYISQ